VRTRVACLLPSPGRAAHLVATAMLVAATAFGAAAHEEKDGPREGPAARAEKKKAKAEAAVRESAEGGAAAPAPAPAGSAPAADPPAAPPVAGSPFGPPWDPVQGPPQEPKEKGRGIESLTLVATGRAEVQELPAAGEGPANRYFAAVLELRIAPESTSPLLGAESVFATAGGGEGEGKGENKGKDEGAVERIPAAVACLPTAGVQVSVWHGPDLGLAGWNVAVAGRTWYCGGRTARLAVRLRSSGIRVSTPKDSAWNGPFLLLFDTKRDDIRRVTVAGKVLDVPAGAAPAKAADAAPAPAAPPAAN